MESPDLTVVHVPESCSSCGSGLDDAELVDVESRQVFDLPEIRLLVTEHSAERRRCSCGAMTKASFPPDATAPACYGPGVRALAAYLAVHQHLPFDRMAQLFADVLCAPVSVGTVATMVTEAAESLDPFLLTTRSLLHQAPAVHFDETGARVEGSLHRVHSDSTALLTLVDCHKKRRRAAMDDLGVIGKMMGVAIYDGWKPYRRCDVDHALCNAYHLRELIARGVGWAKGWANDLADLLREAKRSVDPARAAGADHLDAAALHSIRVRYGHLVAKGFAANPEPAAGKRAGCEKKAFNLLKRLDAHRTDVLRFTTNFAVPFDNYADIGISPTTRQSATSAWSSSNRRSPARGAPSPERSTSAPSAATARPCASTTPTSSPGCACCSRARSGCPQGPEQLRWFESTRSNHVR